MVKEIVPNDKILARALGKTLVLWSELSDYVHSKYPSAKDEWKFPGLKYGWSLRITDRKRAIIYLLPRVLSFKVAFVFGQKATDTILKVTSRTI